jgi:predicted dehydrogenase
MKIAIFGAGLIGRKRGLALGDNTLAGLYDPDRERAAALAADLGTRAFESEAALLGSGCDIAIIATTNASLSQVAARAIDAGKHVLVEKPVGVSVAEIDRLIELTRDKGVAVKVGFNHRFHPALAKMRRLVDEGRLGPLMFLRARYGHGGRLGYESEWRANPRLSGGGELIDQGVHLLDLVHWFFGPLPLRSAFVTTSFWKMPVDDNAVVTLAEAGPRARWATFHVSCSEWKNTFSLELYGQTGKVLIQGFGGSYGQETLTFYKMLPQMGPPEIEVHEFAGPDGSWALDLQNLVDHVTQRGPLLGDLESARYAMQVVGEAYRANGFSVAEGA